MTAPSSSFDALFRIEFPRLVAGLTRLVRDVGWAEELAQEALIAALEEWPTAGVPDRPGAWLMTTAKRRGLDRLRRRRMAERKHEALAHESDSVDGSALSIEEALDGRLGDGNVEPAPGDDLLRLVFISCHPLLAPDARAALTLRLLGGLTTEEIARAFLVPEPTIAQRIVRAKKTLSEKKPGFDVPRGAELRERLESVLEVLYLIFNEGYSATVGDDWMRPSLTLDAVRLARVLAQLLPEEPEVHGLVALLEIQSSRTRARVGPDGQPILLLDQNRAQWDWILVKRGLDALARAETLGGAGGFYTLQAAIAACHARARTAEATDWKRIAVLYYALSERFPSPVVELNRVVAVSRAFGAEAGLRLLEPLLGDEDLADYHLLPSVHGDLLEKLDRHAEASRAFEKAASLTKNERERALLTDRALACRSRRS